MSVDVDCERWMSQALEQARLAGEAGEVPVGAVVVLGDRIVGRGRNSCVTDHDPTAHAEINALREAARHVANYRLPEASLYVTLEPCTMCAGAAVHARIGQLVYGATEPKSGAIVSTAAVLENSALNHRVGVTGGVMAADAAQLLQDFFAGRRGGQNE